MTGNGRVIVGCTHGDEDGDRVLVALAEGAELQGATPLTQFAGGGAMTFSY